MSLTVRSTVYYSTVFTYVDTVLPDYPPYVYTCIIFLCCSRKFVITATLPSKGVGRVYKCGILVESSERLLTDSFPSEFKPRSRGRPIEGRGESATMQWDRASRVTVIPRLQRDRCNTDVDDVAPLVLLRQCHTVVSL